MHVPKPALVLGAIALSLTACTSPQNHHRSATSDAASPNIDAADSTTVIVNKQRPLTPQDYAPHELKNVEGQLLRPDAAAALEQMLADMRHDGIEVSLISGYRSFEDQTATYQHWVKHNGQKDADSLSARPGFSEHQTGLAIDLGDSSGCNLRTCFADTPAAHWAADHAHRYGFVLRFAANQSQVTGYEYEPWHFRYIGKNQAADFMSSSTMTLEEFYGTGPAPHY